MTREEALHRASRLTTAFRAVLIVAVTSALLIPRREVPFVCRGNGCPLDVLGPTYDYQIGLRLLILGLGLLIALVLLLLRKRLEHNAGRSET
jgi:hypothetical protein